jgi:membrane protease YdiL (CAAX protease family)
VGKPIANLAVTGAFVCLHFVHQDITLPAIAGWTALSLVCGVAAYKTNGWVAPSIVHLVYNSRFFAFAPLFLGS